MPAEAPHLTLGGPLSHPRFRVIFRWANESAAVSEWTGLANYEFDSQAECFAAENGVQNALQRPTECVATDDARFRQ